VAESTFCHQLARDRWAYFFFSTLTLLQLREKWLSERRNVQAKLAAEILRRANDKK